MIKKFSNKFLIACMVLAGSALGSQAQNAVRFTEPDGKELILMLSDTPTVSVEDGSLHVQTDKESLWFDNVGAYRFDFIEFDDAGVENVGIDTPVLKISASLLEASNLVPSSPLRIYDMAGKNVKGATVDSMGSITLDLSDLSEGVYVVNTSKKNFKFYKK